MSLCQSLFDCEQEEELKVLLKLKDKSFSSCDDHNLDFSFQRKIKILNNNVKQLVEYDDLAAIENIKELIMGDPNVAAGLTPLVFERVVKILVENNKESTKGSAACILAFANFDDCGVGIKEEATEVLVKLMSDDCATISIPVVRTLTRLAYVSADYASFIVENGALEGMLAAFGCNFCSLKRIQNMAKFLVVVVRQVEVPSHKVGTLVTILDMILNANGSNLRYIVRACYTLSYIAVEQWVNIGNIFENLTKFIRHQNHLVAYSALRAVANIVKLGNSCKICEITEDPKFLRCLGRSKICRKPKKFRKEACLLISNIAANIAAKGRSSLEEMEEAGLIDALSNLLEVDEIDERMEAALAIHNIIRSCSYKKTGLV